MFNYPIENLIECLKIVSDHCDVENHQSMVGTINETIDVLIDMFELLNEENLSHDIT